MTQNYLCRNLSYNALVGFYGNSIVVNTDDHYHINYWAIIGDIPLM